MQTHIEDARKITCLLSAWAFIPNKLICGCAVTFVGVRTPREPANMMNTAYASLTKKSFQQQ